MKSIFYLPVQVQIVSTFKIILIIVIEIVYRLQCLFMAPYLAYLELKKEREG